MCLYTAADSVIDSWMTGYFWCLLKTVELIIQYPRDLQGGLVPPSRVAKDMAIALNTYVENVLSRTWVFLGPHEW